MHIHKIYHTNQLQRYNEFDKEGTVVNPGLAASSLNRDSSGSEKELRQVKQQEILQQNHVQAQSKKLT